MINRAGMGHPQVSFTLPQNGVHFGAGKKRIRRKLFAPLVRTAAFIYTHPKSMPKTLLPLLKPEQLHLFEPIDRVALKTVDGIQLQGYWLESPVPTDRTIVMGHGYGCDFREVLGLAQPLRKRGYHIMLFDFRAHGQSKGKRTSIGYHEGKDVAAAVSYAKKSKSLKARNLFYVGHSMGSASIMAASKSLEKHPQAMDDLKTWVDGIVLDVPYAHLDQMAERFVTQPDILAPHSIRLKLLAMALRAKPVKVGRRILDGFKQQAQKYLKLDISLADMQPHKIMAKGPLGQKPILVTHGTADTVTPYAQGKEVYEHLKSVNPDVRMMTMDGADHENWSWDPAQTGDKYVSAQRANGALVEAIDKFCEELADRKRLIPEQ